jgi:hypothetical protein
VGSAACGLERRTLRATELAGDYEAAFAEWITEDAEAWETTVGDGLSA